MVKLASSCRRSLQASRRANSAHHVALHLLLIGCRPECLALFGGQPIAKPNAQFLDALDPPHSSRKIGAEEPAVCHLVSKTAHSPDTKLIGAWSVRDSKCIRYARYATRQSARCEGKHKHPNRKPDRREH